MAERKASRKNPGLHLSKKERSKIKIMHAAKGLFEEHGVGNVTFQMIADRADMCRTTIFNHFNGMDELMVALTAREVLDIQEYCEEYALHGMDLIYGLYDKLMEDTAYYPALASTLINDAITSKDGDNPIRIIEEMTVSYGSYGAAANDRIDTLLAELSSIDPTAGIRWSNIMDIWRSPDLGQPLNYDVLPDGLPDTDELCIVVLGFQLNSDGTMKDELIQRLAVALNSAKKYPKAYIVCTGGGTASDNSSASEAGKMAEWLAEKGIDKSRIIVEDNSITTAQNAIFTYDILTSLYPSVKKLAIVSSDYHIATGELLFKAEAILRSNAPGNEKLEVISNAAWKAPSGALSSMFQAGALIELFGDVKTAFDIYYDNYDIHSLPPLH